MIRFRFSNLEREVALKKRGGFSILELLVVAGIFALILALTSLLYFRGRDAMAQSSDKVDTAGRARRALDVLSPLVASAIETGGFEGLEVFDPTLEDMADACHLDITTRENFLAPNYDPNRPFDPGQPYYRFRLAFEPETSELRLYQLKLVPVEIDSTVKSRLIAHNVLECRFESKTVGSVSVNLRIRSTKPDPRRPEGYTVTSLESILTAPGTRI